MDSSSPSPPSSSSSSTTETRQQEFNASEVIPGFLYLGSRKDSRNYSALKSLGITHILNCAFECKVVSGIEFQVLQLPLKDENTQDISFFFEDTASFIDGAKFSNGRVLVNCIIGKSRSAAIVISYLMRDQRLSLKQAFLFLRERRPFILPNDGFMTQLMKYELALMEKWHGKEKQIFGSILFGEWKDSEKYPIEHEKLRVVKKLERKTGKKEEESGKEKEKAKEKAKVELSEEEKEKMREHQRLIDGFTRETLSQGLLTNGYNECFQTLQKEGQSENVDKLLGKLCGWVSIEVAKTTNYAEAIRKYGVAWKDVSKSLNGHVKSWFKINQRNQSKALKDKDKEIE